MEFKVADPSARTTRWALIAEHLPKSHWKMLSDLILEEHARGVREAAIAAKEFRKRLQDERLSLNKIIRGGYLSLGDYRPGGWLFGDSEDKRLMEFLSFLERTGSVTKGKPGAPKKTQRNLRIVELANEGKSYGKIAKQMSYETGEKVSRDAVIKVLQRYLSNLEREVSDLQREAEKWKKLALSQARTLSSDVDKNR